MQRKMNTNERTGKQRARDRKKENRRKFSNRTQQMCLPFVSQSVRPSIHPFVSRSVCIHYISQMLKQNDVSRSKCGSVICERSLLLTRNVSEQFMLYAAIIHSILQRECSPKTANIWIRGASAGAAGAGDNNTNNNNTC